jgi:hypothetical protein
MAGSLTMGSSLKGAVISSLTLRFRWTVHSSFCLRIGPIRRVIASSVVVDGNDIGTTNWH